MANEKNWGPWTVYRRKEDEEMWRQFLLLAQERGVPVSNVLADLARGFVDKRWADYCRRNRRRPGA